MSSPEKISTAVSYCTGTLTAIACWTIHEWVALVGGLGVLATFITNWSFRRKKERREAELHTLEVEQKRLELRRKIREEQNYDAP